MKTGVYQRSLGLFCVSALAAGLAGCSSSSSGIGRPADSTGGGGPAATQAAAAGAPSGAGRPIDVCAVVNAAKAAQLSGQAITSAVPRTGLEPHEYGCGYSNDDSSVQVQLTVFEHGAKVSYDLYASQSKHPTPVSGLGDKAFYDNDQTMYVLAGNDLVQVNGVDGADRCAALARPLLAAL